MTAIILALLAAPLGAGALPSGTPARVGILCEGTPSFLPEADAFDRALVAGQRHRGYILGLTLPPAVLTLATQPIQ